MHLCSGVLCVCGVAAAGHSLAITRPGTRHIPSDPVHREAGPTTAPILQMEKQTETRVMEAGFCA